MTAADVRVPCLHSHRAAARDFARDCSRLTSALRPRSTWSPCIIAAGLSVFSFCLAYVCGLRHSSPKMVNRRELGIRIILYQDTVSTNRAVLRLVFRVPGTDKCTKKEFLVEFDRRLIARRDCGQRRPQRMAINTPTKPRGAIHTAPRVRVHPRAKPAAAAPGRAPPRPPTQVGLACGRAAGAALHLD